jgi:hypothetical protein
MFIRSMDVLKTLKVECGLILISTQLIHATMYPGQLINLWYAAPGNRHISLYTKK